MYYEKNIKKVVDIIGELAVTFCGTYVMFRGGKEYVDAIRNRDYLGICTGAAMFTVGRVVKEMAIDVLSDEICDCINDYYKKGGMICEEEVQ